MTNRKWFGTSSPDPVEDIMRRLRDVETYANDLERRVANLDSPHSIARVDPVSYMNPYEGQRAVDPMDEQHMWYSNGEWRKASGPAVYEIKVFLDTENVVAGDRAFVWEIPQDLDGCKIIRAGAFVTTTGGTNTITITDETNGDALVLDDDIVIDSGELSSKTGTTPTADYDVEWGYQLSINVVDAGGMGLGVWVVVQGANVANALIIGAEGAPGADGAPGGVTDWTGQWLTATAYTESQAVSNNGVSYVAIQDHTSGSTSEPGVGANWEDYWQVLVEGTGGGGAGMSSDITQTAHGLSTTEIVRFDGSDYVLAQADSEANAEVVGIVSAVADANNFTLQMGGAVTGLSGLTPGTVYYLDPSTPGALTDTEPFASGQVSKPLLIATSATEGYFYNFRGVELTDPIVSDGWADASETLTYASATTFTVTGDQTVKYSKGTRIKLTQTTAKYFVVIGSSFSSGTTTVTITGGTDYTLANAAITSPFYSYQANPQGYPPSFNYTPTMGGFSANPSSVECGFSIVGGVCTYNYRPNTQGTSNATTFTVSLPVVPLQSGYALSARIRNNGTDSATPGLLEWVAASATLTLYRDGQGLAWTNSGGKWAQFIFSYLI